MNILLANMPIKFNKKENLEPPLGICYIASCLKEGSPGHKIFLKDYEVEYFSEGALKDFLISNKIDIVGVSFRTASYKSAKIFMKAIKEIDKNIIIVGGGHHATAFPVETLKDTGCEVVIKGEGEYAFLELIKRLQGNESLKGLKGVIFREGSDVYTNPDRPPIDDIDRLPIPARELLPLEKYNVMTLLTSRGCPFKCIYCDKGISTRIVKYRSPENILNEIEYIVNKIGKERLYIVDDHFFLNRNRTNGILDRIINSGIKIKWICQARADGIDREILLKAKRSGCEQIMYGLETGDEDELIYIKKNTSLHDAREAVKLTKEIGIKARANFMLGFPISTHESTKNTIRFARSIAPDIVRFFAVSPLPNTELWDYLYGDKTVNPETGWENFDFYSPNFETRELTREDISLYVLAGYWHTLKERFLLEITVFFLPNIIKLLFKMLKTGRLRGNISLYFPTSVNLILDTLCQFQGKDIRKSMGLIMKAVRLEMRI